VLVLSRKVGDRVVIPDLQIEVVVLSVEGGKVRLGWDVPRQHVVLRGELVPKEPVCDAA
jgi:carbon storage regulator CsrA